MQETISLSNNRLLGRPAPIFYFNCEHVLFKYIVKQKQTKIFKNQILLGANFENSIIHKPSLGSCEVPQQI